MAFTFTWQDRAQSIGPKRSQYFTYTALAGDTSATVTPKSFCDHVDYVIINGCARTAADTFSGTSATLTVQMLGTATYTCTITSASATVGTQYYDSNGNQFSVGATISSATTVTLVGPAAVAPAGTITKESGGPAGDAATLVISATTAPTLYGTGVAVGV